MSAGRTGLLSAALGSLTQGSRFVLLLALARWLEPADVGTFALAAASVAYAQYFLGADFYAFSTRELAVLPAGERPRLLRTHVAHAGLTYRFVLPALLLLFAGGILRWRDLPFFYAVLLLDHVGQELYRVATALGRPLQANSTFFVRSGAWSYAVVGAMAASPSARTLATVWISWIVGTACGLLLALWLLRDAVDWRAAVAAAVDPAWLREGTRRGLRFLWGTLALRGITVLDRFILQYFAAREVVGVYALYAGIASSLQLLVNYGSTMVLYPKLVAAHAQGRATEFDRLLRRLAASVALTVVPLALVAGLAVPPLLRRLARPIYADHLDLLWLWLVQAVVASLALVPHYALFARRLDRSIVAANVAGFVASLVTAAVAVPRLGALGAVLGPLAGSIVTGAVDLAYAVRARRAAVAAPGAAG